jgi:transcriptional regulator with XRE-family HTH domain
MAPVVEARMDGENENRQPLGGPPDVTGWTRMLRQRLVARRKALGLTQEDVARIISADPVRNASPDASERKPIGDTTISNWETLYRNPKMHDFAAWARALDLRLIVDLDDRSSDRVPVLLPPGAPVELAKAIATLSDDDLALVEQFVRRLIKE